MPPLGLEVNFIGLMALAGLYIAIGLPWVVIFVTATAVSVREDHARRVRYSRTLERPSRWDYVDPNLIAVAVAIWLLVGLLAWVVIAEVYCGVSPEPLCRPFDYFPLRFVAVG